MVIMIALVAQKGGTGKTTLALTLEASTPVVAYGVTQRSPLPVWCHVVDATWCYPGWISPGDGVGTRR